MTTGMACQHCGAPVNAGARFCVNCGADVSAEQGNVATRKFTSTQAMHDQLLARVRHAALGEHEILTELGRGGMATVYLAHDIQLDRKVAIKVMLPALLEGDDMVERFRLEARTAAALSHPHIIPIYTVRASEGLVYFVMKFVEGRPLDAIVKELGQLPVPMVRTILSKVGEALGYAHRRGVVHRDIKPANLMIDVEGQPVVTDFGIAKVADAHGLTMTGAMMGTPTYMSPEQCSAGEITGASDQYSLGVVAYQLLGGRVPFEGDTLVGLLYKHCHEPPAPLLAARPDCPPQLAAAVMRMLEKDPAHRFPTMEAAVEAIGAVTLAFDDPIRTQLVGLAKRGENVSLLKRISTPSSPVPMRASRMGAKSRSTAPLPDEVTTPAATQGVPGRKRPMLAYAAGAVAVVAVALLAWTQPWSRGDESPLSQGPPVNPDAPASPVPTDGGTGVRAETTAAPLPAAPVPTEAAVRDPAPAVGVVTAIRFVDVPEAVTVGESPTLRATAHDGQGRVVPDRPVTWSSTGPAATITREGVLTARAPGTVTVTARAGTNASQSRVLRVEAVRAASVTLSALGELTVGESERLTATVRGEGGRPYAGAATFQSSKPDVARIENGVVSAVSPGESEIIAAADGREAKITVRVRAAEVASPAPVTPPLPAPAANPREEIVALVRRYAQAVERKQLSEVRAVYPSLPAQQEAFFTQPDRDLDSLKVTLSVGELDLAQPNLPTAAVTGRYLFFYRRDRRPHPQPVSFLFTLQRGPSGWQIRSIADVP